MSLFEKSRAEAGFAKEVVFRLPSEASAGNGMSHRNGQDQTARKLSIEDKGKVRLGGFGPAFRTSSIKDDGKVRLGGFGPIFRT